MTTLSAFLASARRGAGELTAQVTSDWMQGRSLFGGAQAALALAAMRTVAPDATLRCMQATFVAPVPEGSVRVRAEVLRTGKNTAQVEARLDAGASTLAVFMGVFGAPRASKARVTREQPAVRSEQSIELPFIPGVTPDFTRHFAVRWLRGAPPYTSDTSLEHVLAIGMRDQGHATEAHVLAIADFIPPIVISRLPPPAPGSTLTWMVEMLVDRVDHLPLEGWRVDAELFAARDGYTNQSLVVWGPDGVAVALGRQTMTVFA